MGAPPEFKFESPGLPADFKGVMDADYLTHQLPAVQNMGTMLSSGFLSLSIADRGKLVEKDLESLSLMAEKFMVDYHNACTQRRSDEYLAENIQQLEAINQQRNALHQVPAEAFSGGQRQMMDKLDRWCDLLQSQAQHANPQEPAGPAVGQRVQQQRPSVEELSTMKIAKLVNLAARLGYDTEADDFPGDADAIRKLLAPAGQ